MGIKLVTPSIVAPLPRWLSTRSGRPRPTSPGAGEAPGRVPVATKLLGAVFLATATACSSTPSAPNPAATGGASAIGGMAAGGMAAGGIAGAPVAGSSSGGAAIGGSGGVGNSTYCTIAEETLSYDFSDKVAPSAQPPGGLSVEETPQFVAFGWDDNGRDDGFRWSLDMARVRKNPDGSPLQMTYFLTSKYISPSGSYGDPQVLIDSWRAAAAAGHELGLHSVTHQTGKTVSEAVWVEEVGGNLTALQKPYAAASAEGPGLERGKIFGWRTPFLSTNDSLLGVVKSQGVWYDTSLEEGYQYDQDGKNFLFPYTLDDGSPGDKLIATWGPNEGKEPITTNRPGLWELPVYVYIAPPELRATLKARQSWFDEVSGKITGFDYNLIVSFEMSKAEYLATLKYTLDQRLAGNRAPFLVGAHTDYYSPQYTEPKNITSDERRQAVEEFVDYALTKSEVRFRSYKQVFDWMRRPRKLNCK